MGVLQNCNDTVTYRHDLPVTSLFTELENANVLSYTDHLQHSDSDQRRTVEFFSIYLHYKAHDQGGVMKGMESLFEQNSTSTAFKAKAQTLLEELKNFSTPTQHSAAHAAHDLHEGPDCFERHGDTARSSEHAQGLPCDTQH